MEEDKLQKYQINYFLSQYRKSRFQNLLKGLEDEKLDRLTNGIKYELQNNLTEGASEFDDILELIVVERINRSKDQRTYSSDLLTSDNSLRFESFENLLKTEYPPNNWLVDKLIPANGITCVSGKPKVGKSFFILQLAISLASGIKFLDHFEVDKGPVLIITKEDPPRLIQQRLKDLSKETLLPIHFCTESNLYLDNDNNIEELKSFIQKNDIKTIIIDSFRRIFKGEENSSQVISEVHNRFKKLLELELALIFIHHHGKEGFFKRQAEDKLRGSSDILAMLDCLLIAEKVEESKIKITQAALRSDKSIEPFIIEFPNFDGENPCFKFVDFIEQEKEKIETAKKDILSLLEQGESNQKGIIEKLSSVTSYGATTIKNALKGLVESKEIDVKPNGREKVYFLTAAEAAGESG